MSAVSSVACRYALFLLSDKPYRMYVQSAAIVLVTVLVYALIYIFLAAALPKVFTWLSPLMPVATFNAITLGVILLTVYERFTVPQIIVFCILSSIGYLLASFLIGEGKAKLSSINIPKYAKGLPILLLYTGLLSLAFYGLIGHSLPY
jgi:electron transport complex protein RnfA